MGCVPLRGVSAHYVSVTPRKKCACCNEKLALTAFGRNRQAKDGLHYYCKKCAAAKQKKWAKANPATVKAMRAVYTQRVHEQNEERDPYSREAQVA